MCACLKFKVELHCMKPVNASGVVVEVMRTGYMYYDKC